VAEVGVVTIGTCWMTKNGRDAGPQLPWLHYRPACAGIKIEMPNRQNKVLLLVEPEQRISPLKLVLETEQYNVLTATNANNAEQLVSRFPINAVLIDADATAAQYDCQAVARVVKTQRNDVPVILLSTKYWSTSDACEGADYLIAKGSSPVEMIRAIEKLLGDPQPEVNILPGSAKS
jgi:DNA-binding response OmpR family regulator